MSIWANARRDLEELARRDEKRLLVGAALHGYELEAPIAESEIARFEKKERIELPAEYKSFLLEMGNGGAGPGLGLFPLGRDLEQESLIREAPLATRVVMRVGALFDPQESRPFGKLSEPFPFHAQWNLAPADTAALLETSITSDSDVSSSYYRHPTGALPICTHGGGLRDWLVVDGDAHSSVWHDARSAFAGWIPWVLPDGSRMTFRPWYESWLRAGLAGRPSELPGRT